MGVTPSLSDPESTLARRRIHLTATPGQATAELEDNFHHFRVTLRHDGATIRDIASEAIRFPWSTCGGATEILCNLTGKPLKSLASTTTQQERYSHCTHLFDLTSLAIDQALRGEGQRTYLAENWVRKDIGPFEAILYRDGEIVLTWHLDQGTITGPAPYSGVQISRLPHWAADRLTPDEMEAAMVLRRAVHISKGVARNDLSGYRVVGDMNFPATCYSMQPDHASQALNNHSLRRDLHWPEDSAIAAQKGGKL